MSGVPVHVTVKLRHGIVRTRRAELGLSQAAFAKACGVRIGVIIDLELMRPVSEKHLAPVAAFCGCEPGAIWACILPEEAPRELQRTMEIDPASLLDYARSTAERLTLPSPADNPELDGADRRAAIDEVLRTLPWREREIVKLRYGIGDGQTYTIEEVGRRFHISGSRVQQIESKAIRKLRHPIRSRKLLGFMDVIK